MHASNGPFTIVARRYTVCAASAICVQTALGPLAVVGGRDCVTCSVEADATPILAPPRRDREARLRRPRQARRRPRMAEGDARHRHVGPRALEAAARALS